MSKKTRAGKSSPSVSKASRGKGLTRRGFLGTSAAASGVALAGKVEAAQPKTLAAKKAPLTLNVNGKQLTVKVEPRITLLRALRNDLDITGPKEICDRGACGGCSVQIDGKLVNACMMLAVDAAGKKITTVEGLAHNGKLHPLQAEFVKYD